MIKCKFCNNPLSEPNWVVRPSLVDVFRCAQCPSRIPGKFNNEIHSKHTVYFTIQGNQVSVKTSETFILDQNIVIAHNYVTKKTTISEYVFGGPMEIELNDLISIPLTNIYPLDPELMKKIKLYLTFS